MKAPIYQQFYVVSSEDGDIQVHFPDFSGESEGYDARLKKVDDLQEMFRTRGDGEIVTRTLYVLVEHDLEWPYAKWDCEEISPAKFAGEKLEPRRFCEAALVATPKAALL